MVNVVPKWCSSGLFILLTILLSISIGEVSCNEHLTRSPQSGNALVDDNIVALSKEIKYWVSLDEQTLENMPIHLKTMITALNQSVFEKVRDNSKRTLFQLDVCGPCELTVALVIAYARIGGPVNIIFDFIVAVCSIFVFTQEVCHGLVYEQGDMIEYIIHNTNANSIDICALALALECGPYIGPDWSVTIPERTYSGGQPEILNRESLSKIELESQPKQDTWGLSNFRTEKPVLKVLHLTDPHYDADYVVGSNAVCQAPMCCNNDSGTVAKESDAAGLWGDYRDCDAPRWLIENMFHHIKTNHPDLDFIFYTGDVVSHYLWKATVESNVAAMQELDDLILEYFPGIPIYGTIGNHDSFPVNSFPPPEATEAFAAFNNQWLYDTVTDSWEKFLNQTMPSTARYAGYYSILIRPDLRIISINTNFCYTFNWWILVQSKDPGNVLSWLVDELQGAEERNEFVHIIGHVPTQYEECYKQWSHQFSRIVTRYTNIIRGQYYGHTHSDEVRVQYDTFGSGVPVGVQYITPTSGPFVDFNPTYRIFYIDGDHSQTTRHILDYDNYVLNLTRANTYNDPLWHKLYSAREDLALPDLLPRSWQNFAQRLREDSDLFNKYYRYQVQDSDILVDIGCNNDCKENIINSIVNTHGQLD